MTDNSLIKQTYNPKYMDKEDYNLAGFGMALWDKNSYCPEKPFIYKNALLPFFDFNLKALATKINANCCLAHIRGVPYKESEVVISQNAHPFLFEDTSVVLAHNGGLINFGDIKPDLCKMIDKSLFKKIQGNTDSEWIYALLLTVLRKNYGDYTLSSVKSAVIDTLHLLHKLYIKKNISGLSAVNLFITDGNFILSTRYAVGFTETKKNSQPAGMGFRSLWYACGDFFLDDQGKYKVIGKKEKSIIFSSEPLTQDSIVWKEVPQYSLLTAQLIHGTIDFLMEKIE